MKTKPTEELTETVDIVEGDEEQAIQDEVGSTCSLFFRTRIDHP